MKDYLFDVKVSDSAKRKRALKELGELDQISEEARARMKLKDYQEIRTRERKINKFLKREEHGVNYE